MASKKKGGRVVDLTVEVLKDIRAEVRKTNEKLDVQQGMLAEHQRLLGQQGEKLDVLASITLRLVDQVGTLEKETIRGFAGVRRELDRTNGRLDNLIDVAGGRSRGHEERLEELEQRVSALETRR